MNDQVNDAASCEACADGSASFDPGPRWIVTGTLTVEVVRQVAKLESPLIQLKQTAIVISTITDVTFFGQDLVGNAISATGSTQINFAN